MSRGGTAVPIASAKQKVLIAFLAVADPKTVTRAQLIDLLWGSRFDEQARQSLRQALSRIRASLGDHDAITAQGDHLSLCADTIESDLAAFRALVADGSVGALKRAADLYRGEFLDGLSINEEAFEHWRTATAGALRDMAIDTLIKLSTANLEAADFAQAIAAAQRAVELDELREDAHRSLMSALAAAGRRADAIRHGRQLEEMLRKELGTDPDPQTRELIADIRAREVGARPGPPPPEIVRQPAVGSSAPAADRQQPGGLAEPRTGWHGVVPDRSAAVGERREITALSYQLAGSAEFLSHGDLDDFWETSRRFHREAAEAAAARGGFVRELPGEAGIAFFGYPDPEEDAAAAALAAGLEIIERCNALTGQAEGLSFQVRIGIATSSAVVTDRPDTAEDVSIVGLAPGLATALQAQAEPNTVLVDNASRHRARGRFRFEFLGSLHIKGFQEREQVWRAVGRKLLADRFSASGNWMAPIVARSAELQTATDRWQKAASGRGQVILVEGEPGIGKSRLLREIRRNVGVSGGQWQLFQCSPRGASTMLHPVVDRITTAALRHSAGEGGLNYPAVERLLRRGGVTDVDAIEVLSFLVGADGPAEDRLRDMPPQRVREQAFQSMRRCVEDLANQGPLLLAGEDIHWIDPTSLDLLVDMMDWVHERPILLVLTSRSAAFEDWVGEPFVTEVTLNRLDMDDAQSLMQSVWDHENLGPLPADAVEVIYRRTDGVPLFVEELTRWVADNRRSDEQDWDALLAEAGAATLSNLLSARLGSLGEAKRVAQAASVIGRKFDQGLLAEILSQERTEAQLVDALSELMKAGITRRTTLGRRVGYAFRHGLIQRAAYGSLLRKDRQQLHHRIFQAVTADPDRAGWINSVALGEHAEGAGLMEQAIGLYIEAGRESSARSAAAEARQLLERALSLAPGLEDDDSRQRVQLAAMAALGPVLTNTEGTASPRACQLYDEAMALARQRPIGEQAELFPVYWGWWFTGADFGIQSQRARQILQQLRGVNDEEVQLQARHCVWAIDFNLGRHETCLRAIEEGLQLYRPDRGSTHRTLYGGHDAKLCALGQRGLSLWLTGRGLTAAECIAAARSWAQETRHVGTIAHALDIEAMFNRYRRDAKRLAEVAREMADFAAQHDLPPLGAKALIFQGWVEAREGEASRGRELIERGFAIQREVEMQVDFPVYREMLAEVCGRCGDPQAGLQIISEAIEEVRRTSHLYWLSELCRRKAKLLRQSGGSKGEAAEAIESALSAAAEQNARMLLLRSYVTALDLQLDADLRNRWHPDVQHTLVEMERDPEVESMIGRIDAARR